MRVKATVIEARGASLCVEERFAETVVVFERCATGSIYDSADPWRDFPTVVDLHARGRLRLSELIGGRFGPDGVNDAMAELAEQRSPRPLVTFPSDSTWT